jgi:ATP-dependent DNA helicase DinG
MVSWTSQLLEKAVERIAGQLREGQEKMAGAIEDSITTSTHLLVQAGTGTGKSLGYLAPGFAYIKDNLEDQVVISTATLALQAQLASKDIPTITQAARDLGFPEITWCVLKGGANYPCLLKIRDAPLDPYEQQYTLDGLDVDAVDSSSDTGSQVVALRHWAEDQSDEGFIAERDHAPSHSGVAWSHISMSGRECVGQSCPYIGQCFVFRARARAAESQVVVTNHALVAMEADHGWTTLRPDLLILDEAHEITARGTNIRSDELSPGRVDRVVRLAGAILGESTLGDLHSVAQRFSDVLDDGAPGRLRGGEILDAVKDLRVQVRKALTAVGSDTGDARSEQVSGALKEVVDISERISALRESDVVYLSMRPHFGPQLVVAPLQVAEEIRESILEHQTSILTSATLKLGDSFSHLATAVGLETSGDVNQTYTCLDVGSPFDYASQGICYVAEHLPAPGREGTAEQTLGEILALLEASQGHALGLFSSMRAAERAADYLRSRSEQRILLQGEGHLPELIDQFLADPQASLLGTLSLWQGVDAPGATCRLVIIDRIPFPRPDEPLLQARQEEASRQGRNGFMDVAATHAGLMLAQGAGRLIRSSADRGVIAILDPRLRTARYGSFLTSCLPPLWMTTNRQIAFDSLARLTAEIVHDTHTQDEPRDGDR